MEGKPRFRIPAAAVFAVFAALFLACAGRGTGWQDSGEFQARAISGMLMHPGGLALSHPLYVLLAHAVAVLFPSGGGFFAINAASAVFSALAVAFLFAAIRRLTGREAPAAALGAVFALSHPVWFFSGIAESHALSTMFHAAALFAFSCAAGIGEDRSRARNAFVALGVIVGLHFAIDNSAFLSLPVYAVFAWRRRRAMAFGVAVALGAAPWLSCLITRLEMSSWQFAPALASAFFAGYSEKVFGIFPADRLAAIVNAALASLAFAPLAALALFGRVERAAGRPERGVFAPLAALAAVHAVFFARYFVPDQFSFAQPTLLYAAVLVAFAVARASGRRLAAAALACLVFEVALPPAAAAAARPFVPPGREAPPGRDEARYWIVPWRCTEDSAERFVRSLAGRLGEGDVVFADETCAAALLALRAADLTEREWDLVSPFSGVDHQTARVAALAAKRAFAVRSSPRQRPYDFMSEPGVVYEPVQEFPLYRIRFTTSTPKTTGDPWQANTSSR